MARVSLILITSSVRGSFINISYCVYDVGTRLQKKKKFSRPVKRRGVEAGPGTVSQPSAGLRQVAVESFHVLHPCKIPHPTDPRGNPPQPTDSGFTVCLLPRELIGMCAQEVVVFQICLFLFFCVFFFLLKWTPGTHLQVWTEEPLKLSLSAVLKPHHSTADGDQAPAGFNRLPQTRDSFTSPCEASHEQIL